MEKPWDVLRVQVPRSVPMTSGFWTTKNSAEVQVRFSGRGIKLKIHEDMQYFESDDLAQLITFLQEVKTQLEQS